MPPLRLTLIPDAALAADGTHGAHLVTDGGSLVLPDDPVLGAVGASLLPVAGRRWQEPSDETRALAPGTALRIEAEPDNPADGDAVAVLSPSGRTRFGYLPAAHAPRFSHVIRRGLAYAATVVAFSRDRAGPLRVLLAPASPLAVECPGAPVLAVLERDGRVIVCQGDERREVTSGLLSAGARRIFHTGTAAQVHTLVRWVERDLESSLGREVRLIHQRGTGGST